MAMEVNPFWVNGVRGLIILLALLLEAQKVRIKLRSKAPTAGKGVQAQAK